MKGSEFLATHAKSSPQAWESATLRAASEGSIVQWPMVDVPVTTAGHTGSVKVSSDVFAIGEPGDFVRLPLTNITGQRILNLTGSLYPTRKLSKAIWEAAELKLEPQALVNRGPNLVQFASHSKKIDSQLSGPIGSLVAGHKKDVVISNIWKPGLVVIYGWHCSGTKTGACAKLARGEAIQPLFNHHDDNWVDYSHGMRSVAPTMTVDGQTMRTEDVLRDPILSGLLSDEGPLKMVRYPTPGSTSPGSIPGSSEGPVASNRGLRGVYTLGLDAALALASHGRF